MQVKSQSKIIKDETFLDRLFQKNQDEKIDDLYSHGYSPKEIANELNISLDYVKDLIEAWEFSDRCKKEQREVLEAGCL